MFFIDKPPDEVLSSRVDDREKELKETRSLIQNLALDFKTRIIVKREIRKEDLWIVEGRERILEKLNQLFAEAKKSINYNVSTNGLIRAYKANADMFEKAGGRGVPVRLLAKIENENLTVAREMAEIVELKDSNGSFESDFISVDSHDLIIVDARPDDLSITHGTDSSVWTNNASLVSIHDQLFTRLWENLPKFKPSETKK